MKYRLICLAALALMAAAALAATVLENGPQERRVHQHLTARQPDAGCGCGGSQLCSHLPLVVIETGGQEIPGRVTGENDTFGESINSLAPDGRDVVDVQFSVIDNQDRGNHPADAPAMTTAAEIRIRGHASRSFEKAPYRLTFVDDAGEGSPQAVMGMAAHTDWVLYGPYLDKSLVRNYMWYNIAGEVMEWAPNVRYCELILDGEYQGLYMMVETITDGEDCRLDLRDSAYGTSVTGYLLRGDRTADEDLEGPRDIYSYLERSLRMQTDFTVRYPKRSMLTQELLDEIELDFAQFEKALYSYDYDTDGYGYWNWIDEDSFIDYFLLNEFAMNSDAGRYSTYIYKDMSGKYKLAVWDFNNACNNDVEEDLGAEVFIMSGKPLYFMLMKSERFVEGLLARYEQLRQTVLSDAYLQQYVDDVTAYLGPAIQRNTQRWQEAVTQWQPLEPASRNVYSQQEAAAQLKDWLHDRGEWLDSSIHSLQQYCHPSRNKNYDH